LIPTLQASGHSSPGHSSPGHPSKGMKLMDRHAFIAGTSGIIGRRLAAHLTASNIFRSAKVLP